MTISSLDDPRAGPFNGNDSQTDFPFAFKCFSKNDLLVVEADDEGAETELTVDSDFTVTLNADQNANPGGTVTYPRGGVPLPTGYTLTIASDIDYTQTADIQNAGGFHASVVGNALDRVTMLTKQLKSTLSRALQLAVSTPNDVDVKLPVPVGLNLIGWNDDGTQLRNFSNADGVSVIVQADDLADDLASTSSAAPGASLVGAYNAQAPAYLKTVSDIANGQVVMIDRLLPQAQIAAIRAGTSTYNCAPDLNDALQAMTNGGGIRAPYGRYYTTEPVVFGATSQRIIFESEGGAILYCAHNGHGIDLSATNENYGWHTVRNWRILGPNVAFPNSAAELAGTSTGAGINCHDDTTSNAAAGYNLTIDNVEVKQFYAGLRLRGALLSKVYALKAFFNQYGILVDGGQTNANDFYGASIRQNRVAGVYSTGATGGSLTNATQNRFWGGIIESNIPYRGDNPAGYSGGYKTSRDLLLSDGGHGVVLLNSYDWSFYDTYFENQNFDVWIGNSSDSNNFVFTRHGNGSNGRVGGFMFSGSGAIKNKVTGSVAICSNTTDVNVVTDNSSHNDNQFLDTEGFNFIPANLVGIPYVRNNSANQSGGGTPKGAQAIPPHGVGTAVEGTGRGEIDGIGTTSATLNCEGMGTIVLSTGITAATTIDLFSNLTPNSFLVLQSQQATYDVTIKSGSVSNASDIVCLNGTNKVFTEAGQVMVFWCNAIGQAIQVS